MYTPKTSRHFKGYTDPKSGMNYYLLATRVVPIQQGFYFVNSGCDYSRRYIWFYCACPPKPGHYTGVVDLKTDEIHVFPETTGSGWMVDPLTGNLWWGDSSGIYMRTPNPADKPVKIAGMPPKLEELSARSLGGTHLTFSPDRSELFVDVQTPESGSHLGTIKIADGSYTEWYATKPGIPYNHGQFCPTNSDLAMVAHEYKLDPVTKKHIAPPLTAEGIYPRLQLIGRDGNREMRPPLNNYATHEWWAESGRAIYYCTKHCIARDRLGENKPELVCHIPIEGGNGTWHAHCTGDERYFIVDGSLPSMGLSWWRGCVSVVRFWNDVTKKLCDLITYNPIVGGWTPENPCPYHIDPHPRFVWDDEWVTFTSTVTGNVDFAIAPVDQLIRATE